MEGVIGSAVLTEITARALSKMIDKYNKQAAIGDKLRKLKMLCIKLHSIVEVSEKHLITNNYLLKWQEMLKEAATDGDEVLFTFHWRALNEASKNTNHQIGTFSPLAYAKVATSSFVHYCHNAAKMLLSLDKDVEKLNNTVDNLEKLSADTDEFLRLVELNISTDQENEPTKGKQPVICNSSVLHLQQEEHRPLNRKRPIDSILDSTKMIESVKRAMRIRFFSFWIV
ncbi:hypothetical protein ACP70R_025726 [Stipagrostis hirtigluma subsp. patula]